MKDFRTWRATATLLTGVLFATPAMPQSAPAAALLVDFEGTVELRPGCRPPTAGKKEILRAPSKKKILALGDCLVCDTGARVTILNSDGGQLTLQEAQCRQPKGYRVDYVRNGKYAAVYSSLGRPAGRDRAGAVRPLIWPAPDVRTRAVTASYVQWRPQSGPITLTLRAARSARVVWTRMGIDGTTGGLHDDELERQLRAQAASGEVALTMDMRITPAQSSTATFTLLNRSEEDALERQLAAAPTGPLAHIVRAEVFASGGLPREALDEYVADLESAPESTVLLQRAATLAGEIGDARAADLGRRADAVPPREP